MTKSVNPVLGVRGEIVCYFAVYFQANLLIADKAVVGSLGSSEGGEGVFALLDISRKDRE